MTKEALESFLNPLLVASLVQQLLVVTHGTRAVVILCITSPYEDNGVRSAASQSLPLQSLQLMLFLCNLLDFIYLVLAFITCVDLFKPMFQFCIKMKPAEKTKGGARAISAELKFTHEWGYKFYAIQFVGV